MQGLQVSSGLHRAWYELPLTAGRESIGEEPNAGSEEARAAKTAFNVDAVALNVSPDRMSLMG